MAITPGTIAVTEGSGKTLDTAAVTIAATLVQREIVCIGSPDASTPTQYVGVTAAGNLLVDGSTVNQPVVGAAASGAAKAGNPVQIGAVFNTTQPTVTNGQAVEAQATNRGARIVATGVDAFNVTVAAGSAVIGHVITDTGSTTVVTGSVAVTQSTTPWTVAGAAASGAAKSGNPVQQGYVFNTTQPTVTNGQAVESQGTARGAAIVATGTDTFNVTVNAALPAGTNVIGHVIADSGSTTVVTGTVSVSQSGNWTTRVVGNTGAIVDAAQAATAPANQLAVGGMFLTAPPTLTSGQAQALQMDNAGNLLVNVKANSFGTLTVSGTVTANQGGAPWSQNVTQFGGVNVSTGTGASGTGIPRVTVSNDSNILSTQSGTWSVRTQDGAGTALTSTGSALDVNLKTSSITLPVSLTSTTITGTVAVTQSTNPWIVAGNSSDNTTNSTAKLPVLAALAGADNVSWNEGTMVPLSVNRDGDLRIIADVDGIPLGLDNTANGVLDQILLEMRAMRTAIVSMVTENGSSVESDFDPQNIDFQSRI